MAVRASKHTALASLAFLLSLSSPAISDEPGCGAPHLSEDEVFLASNYFINDQTAVLERQILYVDSYRTVIGAYVASSTDNKPRDALAFFLEGRPSPSSEVKGMVIEFRDDASQLRRPIYDAAKKTITIFLLALRYQPLKDALDICAPVYAQYREFASGHVWADVHVGPSNTGTGRR
ncbi:hypothetical protein [Aquibium sp. ELW1220]|uniref:hypothetical protein n=1 Tax=Aquibium sp. ELW1220 TaxID=2976766 RepID=UPI0025B1AC22|nr:hypothetical protein [Aquibium sp. ELW1220]MDN2582158.1 hypothetical protein [Aquibium sp. ELW1220]